MTDEFQSRGIWQGVTMPQRVEPAELADRPPDLMELTYEQRKALPAKFHQPHWDGLGSPHSWICTVCWDDGVQHTWPCEVASAGNNGKDIAEAGGMSFSW